MSLISPMSASLKQNAPQMEKDKLRRAARAKRDSLRVPDAADALARLFLESPLAPKKTATPIAGYAPIRSEISVMPLLRKLHEKGLPLALPSLDAPASDIVFRAYAPEDPLEMGCFSIPQPSRDAPEISPDIALVPLLAFDREGRRLGYGRGHYDRALARLKRQKPLLAIGAGFHAQEMPRLPHEPHDVLLDAIITEKEIILP